MWIYPLVFLATVTADFVPIVFPSAWIVMAFLVMKFHLPLLPVLIAGVCGSTLARYLQSVVMPKIAGNYLKRAKQDDLELLGKKLIQKGRHRWFFIFLYTLTPLPGTVLFAAAGIAKMKPSRILAPYYCGRFIGCAILILAVEFAVRDIRAFRHGTVTSVGILTAIVGLLVLFAVLFIDWRALLERNKFRFRFKIWK